MCDQCFAPWEMGVSGLAPDVPPQVVEDAELRRGLVLGLFGLRGGFVGGGDLGVLVLV